MIPEPWPIPPVRSPLEMEAGFLDSDVQERDEVASERSAVSMGCPDQVSECREGIRTLLLCDSAYSGWRWRHFRSSCRSAGERRRRAPRRWTVRNCTSFRFLRGGFYRDCCRPRDSWTLFAKFQGNPSDSRQDGLPPHIPPTTHDIIEIKTNNHLRQINHT